MTDQSSHDKGPKEGLARRQLVIGSAAIAGLAASAQAASAQTPAADPTAPSGLARLGMLDQRFAVTYQHSIPAATRVITDYFAALSARDLAGMAACLHFPFATYDGVDPVVVQSVEAFMRQPPPSMSVHQNPERSSAHDGYMREGSYDVFGTMEIVTSDPVNVCIALTYYRYAPDGKRILRCQGIYAVTNNDRKWAIQLASVVMTPADMMHITYPDTVEMAKRVRIDHDLAYQHAVNAYDDGTYQYGEIASIVNDVVEVFYQRKGNMDPYRSSGVRTRLAVRQSTPRSQRQRDSSTFEHYRAQFRQLGVGNFGFVYGILPETRVIHAGPEKAHVLSGAIRFTAAGEEINYNQQLYLVTMKPGRWGISGSFSYVSPHDRTNDVNR